MAKKENLVKAEYMNCTFYVNVGNPGKFERDFAAVKTILDKGAENLTAIDRYMLLSLYNTSFHKGGKIEGITSLDSSASNCTFCRAMRTANAENADCICTHCYDFAQEQYRIESLNRHSLNMLIMMIVEFTVDELRALTVTQIIRINSSGDTPNEIYARNMIKVCFAFPWAHVGYWAKNINPIIKAVDDLGKPENLTLVQSSCVIGKTVARAKYFDYIFTVYADKEKVGDAIAAGASPCNGSKCKDCGFKCYMHNHTGENIAELLK